MTIPFNLLTATRHGLMLASHCDAYVGRSLLTYGEFSQHETDFLSHYLKPGDVVFDIGANVGALTVPLAQVVGPGGVVFAFEPQRIVYQTLCANVALSSLTNVVAFQSAVGDASCGPSLVVPPLDYGKPNNFGGVALGNGEQGEHVPVWTLDESGLPPAAVVKVDVEGMEPEVLKGGRAYITEHKPVLYLESDRTDRRGELLALIDELGYDAWWHCPPLFNPQNFRGVAENVFGEIVSVNLVCLPRGGKWPAPEGLKPVVT